MFTLLSSYELVHNIEQFYFREARLLDERKYQQWLALCTQDISYSMPSRYIPHRDHALRDTEQFLNVEHELEKATAGVHPLNTPLRDENLLILSLRVGRAFKFNAWGENPPPSTRRNIHNVEVINIKNNEVEVYSNLTLHYNRWGKETCTYTAQRKDVLRHQDGDFKIAKREVILDWSIILGPTVGLFF